MAFSNPPDGWEITGTGATWGTDVLESASGAIGDYAIKMTGNAPTSDFGLRNTDKGMAPVEGGKTYRMTARVKVSSVVAGHTVNIGCRIYTTSNKSALVATLYIVNNAVLSVAGSWLTVSAEVGLVIGAPGRYAELFFNKDDVNVFDFEVDYFVIKREPQSFSAYLSADQTIGNAAWTDIVFDTERTLASGQVHDIGNDYDINTGLYTAPYRAIYHFEASVSMETMLDGENLRMAFWVTPAGGAAAIYREVANVEHGGTVSPTVSGSITLEMNTGDAISVRIYQTSGNCDADGGSAECNFSGFQVSR